MFTLPGLPTQDKYNGMLKEKELQRDRVKKEKMLSLKNRSNPTSRSSSPVPSPSIPSAGSLPLNAEVMNSAHSVGAEKDYTSVDAGGHLNRPLHPNNNGFLRTSTSKFKAWKKEALLPVQVTSVSKEKNSSWGPVQVSVDKSSDPIVQQIRIIENYIKQARETGRWEEVQVFEQNLKDLKDAYHAEQGNT